MYAYPPKLTIIMKVFFSLTILISFISFSSSSLRAQSDEDFFDFSSSGAAKSLAAEGNCGNRFSEQDQSCYLMMNPDLEEGLEKITRKTKKPAAPSKRARTSIGTESSIAFSSIPKTVVTFQSPSEPTMQVKRRSARVFGNNKAVTPPTGSFFATVNSTVKKRKPNNISNAPQSGMLFHINEESHMNFLSNVDEEEGIDSISNTTVQTPIQQAEKLDDAFNKQNDHFLQNAFSQEVSSERVPLSYEPSVIRNKFFIPSLLVAITALHYGCQSIYSPNLIPTVKINENPYTSNLTFNVDELIHKAPLTSSTQAYDYASWYSHKWGNQCSNEEFFNNSKTEFTETLEPIFKVAVQEVEGTQYGDAQKVVVSTPESSLKGEPSENDQVNLSVYDVFDVSDLNTTNPIVAEDELEIGSSEREGTQEAPQEEQSECKYESDVNNYIKGSVGSGVIALGIVQALKKCREAELRQRALTASSIDHSFTENTIVAQPSAIKSAIVTPVKTPLIVSANVTSQNFSEQPRSSMRTRSLQRAKAEYSSIKTPVKRLSFSLEIPVDANDQGISEPPNSSMQPRSSQRKMPEYSPMHQEGETVWVTVLTPAERK